MQLKITCEVQSKQWHLHVEINCEVKSKQWRLHVKITCEVEAKQWLEVIKCIVHVMACLHLYLFLVIISGCENKRDLIRFRLTSILQSRIVLKSKKCPLEINTYLCISFESYNSFWNDNRRSHNLFRFQAKTQSFKHIFFIPTSIL